MARRVPQPAPQHVVLVQGAIVAQGRGPGGQLDELSLQIYEQGRFHPDSLSYDQKLKTMKLIIDAGVRLGTKEAKRRQDELLSGMKPEERKALIEEQKKNAQRALTDLASMEAALEGADYIEGSADE